MSELKRIAAELDRIEESAKHSAQNQFEQTKIWNAIQIWLGLPATLLAALLAVGTGGSLLADLVSKEFAGVLILVSSALGATVAWLRAADRAVSCESSANEYLALQNAARIARTIDLPHLEFSEARERLEELSGQRDALNRQARTPSKLARKRANRNIEEGGQNYEVDVDG